jgi:hypothetical protein
MTRNNCFDPREAAEVRGERAGAARRSIQADDRSDSHSTLGHDRSRVNRSLSSCLPKHYDFITTFQACMDIQFCCVEGDIHK